MKIATLTSAIITLLLMLSAMICTFWLRAGNPGDISVHVDFGIAAVVFCCITVVLLIITMRRMKKDR